MLQRAASNAYSWWAASHLRTSQSKWLDTNLQEMEDRVQAMLKIIEEDADSFARRAEMYYKKRPELINHVEETYRAYRAMAERYDRISGELHKANNTLATAFPDLEFPMQDEDDEFSPVRPPMDSVGAHGPTPPEFPQISLLTKRIEKQPAPKKSIDKLNSKPQKSKATTYTNKDEAKEAIDRLQKGILVLQTEKEFLKSSYERGITKCWEIEKQITEMQQEVTSLQDDFGVSSVIDDDEARALMAVTALKSCKDTLFNLQNLQKRSADDAKIESERIKAAKQKLMALKGEPAEPEEKIEDLSDRSTGTAMNMVEEAHNLQPESPELQLMGEQVNDQFEINSDTSVMELAEKIDELVNKVIGLEHTVSSQAAQIKLLKSETDDLQKHLRSLEEEKESTSDESSSVNDRLKEAEGKLHKIQALEERVKHEKSVLHSVLAEATHSLSDISEKLQSPRLQDHVKSRMEALEMSEEKKVIETQDTNAKVKEAIINSGMHKHNPEEPGERVDASNLAQLLLSGLEGNEKTLLSEYTSILKSYTETKRKLLEVEKKNQEYFSETMAHVTELKSANTVKDDEIQSLRQIVSSLQINSKPQDSEISGGLDMEGTKRKHMNSNTDEPHSTSAIEEKFRRDIDTLLDENLEFWLRFSTSFHQIQRFRTEFQDLQAEVERLKETKLQESGSSSSEQAGKSEPVDKQLRELKTELQVWTEQNDVLRRELQTRFTSLCDIQEEITRVLKATAESDLAQFTPYQAAKFQGEILNMKQENNKVADELKSGLDHVKGLQTEVEKTLSHWSKLYEKFHLSSSKHNNNHNFRHLSTKGRGVPLRSFLYGVKPKKPSLFSCMSPALQKQYSDLKAGMPI